MLMDTNSDPRYTIASCSSMASQMVDAFDCDTNNITVASTSVNKTISCDNSDLDSLETISAMTNDSLSVDDNDSVESTNDCAPKITSRSSYTRSVLVVVLIFIISITVYTIIRSLPSIPIFRIFSNENEIRHFAVRLTEYTDKNYYLVLFSILALYILLQAFAIPGSVLLTVVSGYLFPLPVALFLVCLCSACGASLCYLLSYYFGRSLVIRYFPERAAEFSSQVAKNRADLLNYLLFLRITPIIPNWIINIVSPIIDVPLSTFFLGTFFGVAAPSWIHIQAVKTIDNMASNRGSPVWNYTLLFIMASLVIAPVIYNRLKKV